MSDGSFSVPEYDAGERRIGHPLTDANLFINKDGEITLQSDAGATVTLDKNGDLILNGGSNGVITDVSTQKDADGHVTAVDVTRNNSIKV